MQSKDGEVSAGLQHSVPHKDNSELLWLLLIKRTGEQLSFLKSFPFSL